MGLLRALIRDGRPLLMLTAVALFFSGCFALFLSLTGQFLPHDQAFLGLSAEQLCTVAGCRVVAFMVHDRAAFGGALIAIAVLYLWLVEVPLRQRQAWAWWTLLLSGTLGFLSFLTYLGYGYLDSWHGTGTLFLLPCFVVGMARSKLRLRETRGIRALLQPAALPWTTRVGLGRACLLATAGGMVAAGVTILLVGATRVFVPQDLDFMGVSVAQLSLFSQRLIPLIAHDRAGFGGGLATCGVIVGLCVWCSPPGRSLAQALLVAGLAGFGCAIGVHLKVGYIAVTHLGPAVAGALLFAVGIVCYYPRAIGKPALTAARLPDALVR